MKILQNPQQELISFLRSTANVVVVGDEEWFYCPFWFKDGERLELVSFDNLPNDVKEVLKSNRDGA
jgi:hypothetical protein